jgi:hypothetical protein
MAAVNEEVIRFEWHLGDDETIAGLRLDAERLAPVAASQQLFEPGGAALLGACIIAAMAIPAPRRADRGGVRLT